MESYANSSGQQSNLLGPFDRFLSNDYLTPSNFKAMAPMKMTHPSEPWHEAAGHHGPVADSVKPHRAPHGSPHHQYATPVVEYTSVHPAPRVGAHHDPILDHYGSYAQLDPKMERKEAKRQQKEIERQRKAEMKEASR